MFPFPCSHIDNIHLYLGLYFICFYSSSQGEKFVGLTPEKQKEFQETLNNLKKAYGADKDDYSKFPAFSFPGNFLKFCIVVMCSNFALKL